MAKQGVEKEKVVPPAQGAEGTTETNGAKDTESTETVKTTVTGEEVDELVPVWAVKLSESNLAVIESNNEVINAIAEFKENAGDIVRGILEKADSVANVEAVKTETVTTEALKSKESDVKVNPKGKYVVRKGRKFINKDNSLIYGDGDDVPSLNTSRLKNLLEQGIIEEA